MGEGGQIAGMKEFGGPVRGTPTFVFFEGEKVVGEQLVGGDRRELETRIGMLELDAFPRKHSLVLVTSHFRELIGARTSS